MPVQRNRKQMGDVRRRDADPRSAGGPDPFGSYRLTDDEAALLRGIKRALTVSGPTARALCHAAGLGLGEVLLAYRKRRGRKAWLLDGRDVRFRLYAIASQLKVMLK